MRPTTTSHSVWRRTGLAAAALLSASALLAAQSGAPAARAAAPRALVPASTLIDQGLAAMGGEPMLRGLKSLTLDVVGHDWALEQSERPEGPWLTTYHQGIEIRDYANDRRSVQRQQRNWTSSTWSPAQPLTTLVAGGVAAVTNGQRWVNGTPATIAAWREEEALVPERLLLTAKAAADLKTLPDEMLQRVNHHVVSFTRPGQRLRLFLNAWTHLPTALEIVANDSLGIWGDVTERRTFGFWSMEKGGLMYPRQTSTDWNGFTHADATVETMKVDAPVDDAAFAIPDDVKQAFAAAASRPSATGMQSLTLDPSKAVTLAPGIVQFPAGYNVNVIEQPDGLVVLEATTGSNFSAQAIEAAEQKFPGKKVKAVVTTSDAWPHLGGIREYVARGIPIYALDLNVSILSSVIKAPHTFAPDALSASKKAPIFHPVTSKTTVGTGDNRMDLIPVRGETGERMMLVSFPGRHVLYSSDLLQRDRTGKSFFFIEMPAEVVDAVAREHIDGIETVFGMHLAPTPWSEVTAAVAAARR